MRIGKEKKTFVCNDGVNHTGYGQYCHRCAEADRLQEFIDQGSIKKYPKNEAHIEGTSIGGPKKGQMVTVKLDDKEKKVLAEQIKHLRS